MATETTTPIRNDGGSGWRGQAQAFARDLRLAFRNLARNRGFAATAILTLGLGIGATTAIWSVVRVTLLADLPIENPDRLMTLQGSIDGDSMGGNPLRLLDLQAGLDGTAQVAGFYGEGAVFRKSGLDAAGGEPRRIQVLRTYGDFISVFGAPPILGRNFLAQELHPESTVALVTEPFWRAELGADPHVVGRSLVVGETSLTVVGVVPDSISDLWGVEVVVPGIEVENRKAGFLDLVARLENGVSVEAARARVAEVARRMAASHPEDRGLAYGVVPTLEAITGTPSRGRLFLVLATAGFVLLIVCVNLACLLLARLPERMREGAIRAALGAGPWGLVRAALAESLAVALAGGALGVGVAAVGVPLLVRLLPADLPRLESVQLDFAAVAFALGVAVVCGFGFGLLPALQVARRASVRGLREAGRSTEGRDRRWLRASLVVVELGLSTLLLVGAGLSAQALFRLRSAPLGFLPERLLTIEIAQPWDTDSEKLHRYYERMLAELAATPGVRSAAFVDRLPLQGESQGSELTIPGRTFANRVEVSRRAVSAGYFETVGALRLAGEPLPDHGSGNEALVNEAFARRFFAASAQAVGREIVLDGNRRYRIRGVVSNLRQEAAQKVAPPEVFVDYRDTFWPIANFVVRVEGEPRAMAASVRAAVRHVDPTQVIDEFGPMSATLDRTFAAPRITASLVGGFAVVALLLAAIGLYGVLGSEVAARRRELGIRLALGATPQSILRGAQFRGLGLAALGVGLGLGGGAVLRQAMASALYGGGAGDLGAFALAAVVLLAVAVFAADGPARRASRVDPVISLRSE